MSGYMPPADRPKQKFLLYGKTGWIGGLLKELILKQGDEVVLGSSRLENRESVIKEIEEVKPTRVLNAAGVTGRPNVDWCESNRQTVIRTNVIGCLNLADICWLKGIHCTLYATGCIFEYDDDHPMFSGKGFTEDDDGNFDGSYYSKTKGWVEQMLREYLDHLTVLRVRMPISDDLNPRNFVTKITKYAKVVNIPNSMTILSDLLPVSLELSRRRLSGIFNFCNPGAISHNEILVMYKEIIDPQFSWKNFSVEEQDKILKARRSNNELDCTKLVQALPDVPIPEIHDGMRQCFNRMKLNLQAQGWKPTPREN
uniref:RmlD-like substrate binding domain-containing protein n=1 Tax=Aureoumbra lagunensis TaxID=44058 RepID=A0A7S3JXK2_9STRA|mmetsp:Transcript_3161/g.4393  ORF Transcript_3161/g.4393 Transcript_3161/m.4393 type:complete len:312 (-) Transcript_3161:430-1365(-)